MKIPIAVISFSEKIIEGFTNYFQQHEQICITCTTKSFQYFNKIVDKHQKPEYIFYSTHSLTYHEIVDNLQQMTSKFNYAKIYLITSESILYSQLINYIKSQATGILANPEMKFIEQLILNNNTILYSAQSDIISKILLIKERTTNDFQQIKGNKDISLIEHNILILLINGYSYNAAALKLNMKIDTFRYYIKKVYKKLNANSKQKAIIRYQSLIDIE